MKKLALLSLILISFVCFAQQKAKPFNHVDTPFFKMYQHFLLDSTPNYAFMAIGLEDYNMGVSFSTQGDSIILREYSEPLLHWLLEYNKAIDNGEKPQPPEYTEYILRLDSCTDLERIKRFLQNTVDNAKPFKDKEPCPDGVDWYILANGKWAAIHTGGFHKEGKITDILEVIAVACICNDSSMLFPESLVIE